MKNTFNLGLILEWVAQQGKQGRVKLAYRSGIGYDTIGRILRSEKLPSPLEMNALSKATKIRKSELLANR